MWVGQQVRYHCKSAKQWKETRITMINPDGSVRLSVRSTALKPSEIKTRLRFPQDTQATPQAVEAPLGLADNSESRQRGIHDDTWMKIAVQWINAFGSVENLFQKFMNSYRTKDEISKLKQDYLRTFPKVSLKSVDYLQFQVPPGDRAVRGHVHPCLEGNI